ncbi:ribonuclease toxin immunity protein CdiI [Corallococcus sicarius]|uniref:ribonuclease toxin immunity protein CdiI n=1 Tax=Corallococcus sicarius TaxID=2316726 RepID=UPI0011C49258|nr:ribonuclease toxin immunity protein CdiI [Corallococcus sicarius]
MSDRVSLVDDDDPLFPVQAFFNAVGDGDFVEVVDALVSGVGRCSNDVCCEFPGDLDPGEPVFDGVRCSLFEDSVVVGRDVFFEFMLEACRAYVRAHRAETDVLRGLLCRIGRGQELA